MTTTALRTLTEAQFQRQVVDLAELYGYRCHHPWISIHSSSGWPDIALFRPGRFLLAELKTQRGKLSPAQHDTIDLLRLAGVEVHIWRPSQLEEIREILADDDRVINDPVEAHEMPASHSRVLGQRETQ